MIRKELNSVRSRLILVTETGEGQAMAVRKSRPGRKPDLCDGQMKSVVRSEGRHGGILDSKQFKLVWLSSKRIQFALEITTENYDKQ